MLKLKTTLKTEVIDMSERRKSIFITGAAAGIGRATALRFAAAGWRVGLYDIDAAGVKQLASEIGVGHAQSGALNVADYSAFAAALAAFAESSGGQLDVLLNNAGILSCGDFESIAAERYRSIVEVNVIGVVNGCRAAYPLLAATPGARVINLASASAIYGQAALAVYSASKFFVRGLTEALNIEWQRQDILVSSVMPLFVKTAMVANFETQPRSLQLLGVKLSPEDIANTIYRAASVPRWRSRVHWHVGGGTTAAALSQKLLPSYCNRAIQKYLSGY